MRLCYKCVITCIRGNTNDVYNRSVRNPVENLFFIKKNVQTLKLVLTDPVAQRDLRTSQAKAVQFFCWTGICKDKLFTSSKH